ncbi:ABC transporter permease, partial [Yersinia enterocolitica]|nr:ABC transporter permease [Yersinia enterocolitica]
MLWRMLKQSWFRNVRRKSLAVFTVFLAAGLISSLLAVSIDIGDKMSRELKSYGANILIEPAGQVALPSLFGEKSNPLTGQDFLDQAELPNIKDIFWRNNIVGFAPLLSGETEVNGQDIPLLGTYFNQPVDVPDEEDYHTGQQIISPYWQVKGNWPQEPVKPDATEVEAL